MSKSYIRWAGDLIKRVGGITKENEEYTKQDYRIIMQVGRVDLCIHGLFEAVGLVGEGGRDMATPGSRVGSSLPADGSLHAINTDVYGRQTLSVKPNTSCMKPVGARFTTTQKKSVRFSRRGG